MSWPRVESDDSADILLLADESLTVAIKSDEARPERGRPALFESRRDCAARLPSGRRAVNQAGLSAGKPMVGDVRAGKATARPSPSRRARIRVDRFAYARDVETPAVRARSVRLPSAGAHRAARPGSPPPAIDSGHPPHGRGSRWPYLSDAPCREGDRQPDDGRGCDRRQPPTGRAEHTVVAPMRMVTPILGQHTGVTANVGASSVPLAPSPTHPRPPRAAPVAGQRTCSHRAGDPSGATCERRLR